MAARQQRAVQPAADYQTTEQAVVKFEQPRFPWHDRIGQVYGELGVDKAGWKVLCETTFPNAETAEAILMALAYCKTRKLDVWKKPIHIVPMYDRKQRKMVETIWPGISELRTTAFRTGQYAGCEETKFGPVTTLTFKGRVKGDNNAWEEVSKTVTFPEWAQITVYRVLGGQTRQFVGPKVYWTESYAKLSFFCDVPNDMWARRAHGQLEKVAEAAALRKAFPEEIGNDYAAEEMEGFRVINGDMPRIDVPPSSGGPVPLPPRVGAAPTPPPATVAPTPPAAAAPARPASKSSSTLAFDPDGFLVHLKKALEAADDAASLDQAWNANEKMVEGPMPLERRQEAYDLYNSNAKRLGLELSFDGEDDGEIEEP